MAIGTSEVFAYSNLNSDGPQFRKAAAVVFPLHPKNSANQFDDTREQRG